jgi:DHA3 family macrolide efflux protein-like MFS transporter
VPSLLLTPFQGVLIDRTNKVRLATVSCALRALLMVLIGVALSVGYQQVWIFYGCILLSYLILYFQIPVFESMLKPLMLAGSSMTGVASTQAAWQAGMLGAMVVAGLLMEWLGLASAFFVAAGMSALGALLFTRLSPRLAMTATPSAEGLSGLQGALHSYAVEFKAGWRYTATHRRLLALVIVAASVHPLVQGLNTLIVPFVSASLKTGPFVIGLLEGALGVGSAISAALCVWLMGANLGEKGLLLSKILLVASVGLFASATSLVMASLGYLAIGLFLVNVKVLSRSLVLQIVQAELAGRVMSIVSFIGLALGILIGLAAGFIADYDLSLAYGFIALFLLLPLAASAMGMAQPPGEQQRPARAPGHEPSLPEGLERPTDERLGAENR